MFEDAVKALADVDSAELESEVLLLQSAVFYSNEDYAEAQAALSQRPAGHPSTLNDEGCLLYQVIKQGFDLHFLIIL